MIDACVSEEMLDEAAGIQFIPGGRPIVNFVAVTGAPRRTLGLVTRGYAGKYDTAISLLETREVLDDLAKTKLQTPLSFIATVWLLSDVTRAFCNQLVRYRVGTSFVQESLRFSVHERVRVLLPQKLIGTAGEAPYKEGARAAVRNYKLAMEAGGETQDARGLLPLNTLTSIFFNCNLQTLSSIYTQRMCCQAQSEEWTPVMQSMKHQLDMESKELAAFLKAPWEGGAVDCGFGASFDRPCTNDEKFGANLDALISRRVLG